MATIDSNDLILATIYQRGTTLGTLKLKGVTTFADITRAISDTIQGLSGMVKVNYRNASQGWVRECPVMFRQPA